MARDEADMLPRWVAYYGTQVGVENLLVLDDNTIDGSTNNLPCTAHRLPPGPWRGKWPQARRRLVNGVAGGLLACYDVVIYTDTDEFLIPDPDRYDGLPDYLTRNEEPVIAPVAINVLHDAKREPPLDPSRPLLQQRRYVKFSPGMCKPLIKRAPADWSAGFHGIDAPFRPHLDLLLAHLKFADIDALARTAELRQEVHAKEQRGGQASTWALGPSPLVSRLQDWTADADQAVEFNTSELDLTGVVVNNGSGRYRATGSQLKAMDEQPLHTLPERFRSAM